MSTAYIVMGAPGSGRDELAEELAQDNKAILCNEGEEFAALGGGEFKFDDASNADGCFAKFKHTLSTGQNVVVNKTFSRFVDIRKYICGAIFLDYNIVVQEPDSPSRNDAEFCVANAKVQYTIQEMEELIHGVQLVRARTSKVLTSILEPQNVTFDRKTIRAMV